MGVPLKTENEENPGKRRKHPIAKAGGGFPSLFESRSYMDPPRKISARLTGCLTLTTVVWRLRCSVLRGTPMPGTRDHDFKKLKC